MQTDSLLHFAYSALIVLSLAPFIPLPFAVACSLSIGAAKELLWDLGLGRGNPEWRDMGWNVVGVIYGSFIASSPEILSRLTY